MYAEPLPVLLNRPIKAVGLGWGENRDEGCLGKK